MTNLTIRVAFFALAATLEMTSLTLAQTKQNANEQTSQQSNEPVFMVVEKQPQFSGGSLERSRFFAQNLKIPKTSKTRRVVLSFIVNTDGSLQDVSIVKGQSPEYDREVLRVAKSMPNWIPGSQAGKLIRVKYSLPVEI